MWPESSWNVITTTNIISLIIFFVKSCHNPYVYERYSWPVPFWFLDVVVYTPFLWYRRFYDTAVFILSVPMHCSATRRFIYLYIHKHNSHIYRNVWSFCPNVLNFCKYTYFYLFLRNSGHFYFTLIPCFVKCPIIKP
jgi:hypothetical protein